MLAVVALPWAIVGIDETGGTCRAWQATAARRADSPPPVESTTPGSGSTAGSQSPPTPGLSATSGRSSQADAQRVIVRIAHLDGAGDLAARQENSRVWRARLPSAAATVSLLPWRTGQRLVGQSTGPEESHGVDGGRAAAVGQKHPVPGVGFLLLVRPIKDIAAQAGRLARDGMLIGPEIELAPWQLASSSMGTFQGVLGTCQCPRGPNSVTI